MYIVLCSAMDTAGLWAAHGIRDLLPAPVELVLTETLSQGVQWEHRLKGGKTCLEVTLADGRHLCSSQVRGVVNRLVAPPAEDLRWISATEQEYVRSEMFAFYLSWLHGLPGVVINRPSPTCLTGRFLRVSEWVYRAAQAGLKTTPYRQTDADAVEAMYALPQPDGALRQPVIVAGGTVFPVWMPERVKAGCMRLAREVGVELLGVDLYLDNSGEWRFAGASATPDLTLGGAPLLTRTAAMLQQGGQG